MYTAISVLVFIICLLLILIVLVQNSKGGRFGFLFRILEPDYGRPQETDFLEKATWTLAGAMMVLCIVVVFFIDRGENNGQSAIQNQINAQPVQQTIPSFPGVGSEAPAEVPAETPAE